MSPETLTREQIVKTAVELLDEEGLEGLNMRALGKRLGSAPAATYWHVKNKRDLVALASEHVWKELALPELSQENWRAAAATMATNFRALLIRHTWLLQVFGAYVVYGHERARHDDHNLAIFEAAGFSSAMALLAATAVANFVIGNALTFSGKAVVKRELRRKGQDAAAHIQNRISKFSEIARQYPHLRHLLVNEKASGAATDESFEFGLRAMLDGIGSQLTRT